MTVSRLKHADFYSSQVFLYLSGLFLLISSCQNSASENRPEKQEKVFKKAELESDTLIGDEKANSQTYNSLVYEIDISKIDTLHLGNIKIVIRQDHPIGNTFSCNSYLTTFIGKDTIDHKEYKFIEALGGLAGFSAPEIILNRALLSKEGDYDGRSIVVNGNGEIHDFIGGTNFIDLKGGVLFSTYSSDIAGISVFDLNKDSLIFSSEDLGERPISVHKAFRNRYFIKSTNDNTEQTSIWEFEFELDRLMAVDLDSSDINSSNNLTEINNFRF